MLWQGGVIGDIVDHRGSIGLGVYRREEGQEIVNTCKDMHNMAIRDASMTILLKSGSSLSLISIKTGMSKKQHARGLLFLSAKLTMP